jgi:hypothetical protein
MPSTHGHNSSTDPARHDFATRKALKNRHFFHGPDWHGMCLFYWVVEQSVALLAGKPGLVRGKTQEQVGYIA